MLGAGGGLAAGVGSGVYIFAVSAKAGKASIHKTGKLALIK